jgi:hypothetical protein
MNLILGSLTRLPKLEQPRRVPRASTTTTAAVTITEQAPSSKS